MTVAGGEALVLPCLRAIKRKEGRVTGSKRRDMRKPKTERSDVNSLYERHFLSLGRVRMNEKGRDKAGVSLVCNHQEIIS